MAGVENVSSRGELLSGIKNMYVVTLTCVRVKGSKSEWFRADMETRVVESAKNSSDSDCRHLKVINCNSFKTFYFL